MRVQPYLSFEGRCEEALEFYKEALGAEVTMLMRFKENPESGDSPMTPPDSGEKILHCSFQIGETTIMASDGQCMGSASFQGISLALTIAEPADAERKFEALAEGGQVHMPLTKTFFSSHFGMVADRFGVSWMIMVGP
jgi:PhnB protein